jgi:hypothetical protein
MAEKLITADLETVIARRSRPGVTVWNRLEGRPRADKFDRALRAEVRDALWMLTRQWQLGEFRGDDAGSPILARVRLETTRLRKYQAAAGSVEPFDDSVPLETRVERMAIPLKLDTHETALDIRLLTGRHWIKLVTPLAAAAAPQFIAKYPVHSPDPLQVVDAPTCAHPEAWSTFAAVATQRMDGIKLYEYLTSPGGHRASDGIAALVGLETQSDDLADRFVRWFEKLIYQPPGNPAWLPDRLEYQFAVSSPQQSNEKVFVAEQYYHGHLDWYNFDIDQSREGLDTPAPAPPDVTTLTMLPTQATFNGMPNTRWWAFEDGLTNFGDVRPDTTDLAKLLLVEFGLIYANDWFIVPFTAPAGSVVTIKGMAVTNVFGERLWIEPSGAGDDDDWQRWAMFLVSIAGKGHQLADTCLLLPPTAQQVLDGPALEDIMFARDEMANMVWGVERGITLPSGHPARGREAAAETRAFFERAAERVLGAPPVPPPFAEPAKIRYKVMSSVPENWIPMIPMHISGDVRETQLQRAAMLRIIEGDPTTPAKVSPRTSLLRVGLDATPAMPYFVHEEEVPRAGIQVTQRYQRTRWRDGRVWVWLGVRKQTGRGEGSSGLAFDRLVDATVKR